MMGWQGRPGQIALAAIAAVVAARRRWRTPSVVTGAHGSERPEARETTGHQVLILGAGCGGAAALALHGRPRGSGDACALAVERDSAMLFTPLLWTIAAGRADSRDVTGRETARVSLGDGSASCEP